jgi:hypothetical protein
MCDKRQIIKKEKHLIDLVPEKYGNTNDSGAIINFVYRGVNATGNPDITKIAIDILKKSKKI